MMRFAEVSQQERVFRVLSVSAILVDPIVSRDIVMQPKNWILSGGEQLKAVNQTQLEVS